MGIAETEQSRDDPGSLLLNGMKVMPVSLFAESLAITHGAEGIKVSVLCPQAVATRMIGDLSDGGPAGDGSGHHKTG